MGKLSEADRVQQDRFYILDLIRGLAAFSILFYHYNVLYFTTPLIRPLRSEESATEPLYAQLWILYDHGHYAVNFFWMLSGFVFGAVYLYGAKGTRDFIVHRLARLYPLHLLTLCVVSALQILSITFTGQFQIVAINDLYHFILQLFFASNWGIQKGPSFNAPIWSVSIEVLVYGLFWVTRPHLYRAGIAGPLILAAVAWVFGFHVGGHLVLLRQCVFYFFTGVSAYMAFKHLRSKPRLMLGAAALLALVGVGTTLLAPQQLEPIAVPSILLALLIGCAGLEALSLGRYVKTIKGFGDATYGMYLWHIPILIVVLIYLNTNPGARWVIHQTWFLVCYLSTVVCVAWISFHRFERPARDWINGFATLRERLRLDPVESMAAP
jgi:peptidoglycan/LPS O-acetylase OafA/YrhL